jgi:hypothetical protein
VRRPIISMLAVLALLLGLAGLTAPGASANRGHGHSLVDTVPLPNGFQPEGIAIGRAPVAFFGSRATGDIYRANLHTGRGRIISEGPGTPSLGMKLDGRGRLFVAGGTGGDGRVIGGRSGKVLKSYSFTDASSFVNDVVLTRHAAWFTDSQQAVLYRVPRGKHLADQSRVKTVPLAGDWAQQPGTNANGISQTPNHRALLVVNSATGQLFRVNKRTGVAHVVDLGGASLTNGDGLLLRGRTLFAVQNRLNKIAVLHLSRSGRSGQLVDTITDSRFDVPTTVASFGRSLYLPNARFSTTPTPDTTYSANRVKR